MDSQQNKEPSPAKPKRGGLFGIFSEIAANLSDARAAMREVSERVRAEKMAPGAGKKHIFGTGTPTLHQLIKGGAGGKAGKSGTSGRAPIKPIQHKLGGAEFRRVLIVGDLGFVGAAVARELNVQGFSDITFAGCAEPEVLAGLARFHFAEFISEAELATSGDALGRLPEAFSHVFYSGGYTAADMPLAKSLLQNTARAGGRFIAMSSASSMGGDLPRPQRADPAYHRPLTVEGALACYLERAAKSKAPANGWLALKHHCLFGAGERSDGGIYGIVSRTYSSSWAGHPLVLPATLGPASQAGTPVLDFLSVHEAARIAVALARNPRTEGCYELGSGIAASAEELAQAAFAALGIPAAIAWDHQTSYEPQPGKPPTADRDRLAQGGWREAAPDLAESVAEAVGLMANPDFGLAAAEPAERKPSAFSRSKAA